VTLVVDASTVVAALIDRGSDGEWARARLVSDDLAAPHLMPVEAANILSGAVLRGLISPEIATLAHSDLTAIRASLHPYHPHRDRIWELRHNLTSYDAWYVALAEAIAADLATLDRRLSRAPGLRCGFATPPQ
jgi:predicted nucleic acid-binding protein